MADKISRPDEMKYVHGTFPVEYVYTAGIAAERFFNGLKNGIITGTYCELCDVTYVPAVHFCELCFSRLDDYVDVGKEGEVETFTVAYRDMDGNPLDNPEIWAMISLDDADTSLLHRIIDCEPDDVYIGMPVKAKFRTKKERTGGLFDIEGFVPFW